MNEVLQSSTGLLQSFWWVAIVASIIFIIQTVMTFVGTDTGADGVNADFSGNLDGVEAPFQMFTFRNLVNFLLGFGWAGIALFDTINSRAWLIFVAVMVGIVFVLLFFFIIKQFLKLSEDNTFEMSRLVGFNGDVYLSIPQNMSGQGKVQISYRGTSHELPAMTHGATIPTGSVVKVVSVDQKILIVNKIS